MTRPDAGASLSYFGWSGFRYQVPGMPAVVFDPPDDSGIPRNGDVCLIITHGHPEHIAGAASFLRGAGRTGRAAVMASPGVCRALKRRSRKASDAFYPCRPGQVCSFGGITVDTFACRHMPLLPPEKGEGLKRLGQIVRNPGLAAEIVADVVRFPLAGPLLGYRVTCAGAPSVMFYGEGLHRCVDREAVATVGAGLPGDILITAVEPEDAAEMPDLVSATGAEIVVPYEAHAPWREGFGMPFADLDALSRQLEGQGRTVLRPESGVSVMLPPATGEPPVGQKSA